MILIAIEFSLTVNGKKKRTVFIKAFFSGLGFFGETFFTSLALQHIFWL
jgi:hypothetical protein